MKVEAEIIDTEIALHYDLVFRLVSLAHAAMLLFFAAPGWIVLRDVLALDPTGLSGQAWLLVLVAVWSVTLIALALWWLAFVWTFTISANATGLSQGWALRCDFLPWSQIAAVEVETVSDAQPDNNTRFRPHVTLRDAQGRWLMQVWLGHGTTSQKERF